MSTAAKRPWVIGEIIWLSEHELRTLVDWDSNSTRLGHPAVTIEAWQDDQRMLVPRTTEPGRGPWGQWSVKVGHNDEDRFSESGLPLRPGYFRCEHSARFSAHAPQQVGVLKSGPKMQEIQDKVRKYRQAFGEALRNS